MGNDVRRGVVAALLAVLAAAAGCGGGVPSSEELQANAATAGARGVIALEGAKIPASGTFAVTVTDADANVDPSAVDAVHVYVISTTSAQEPERVSLVETQPGSGVFAGGVPIALGAEVRGNGTVEVANGDTVTVTYRDQNDGTCSPAIVSATAIVDAYSPDLTVASLDVTGDVRAGGVISVSGTVANDARGGSAGASRVELSMWDGSNPNSVKIIGYVDVGALASGVSGSFSKAYTIPTSLGGTWLVKARADSYNWVAETNENNNVLDRAIQITGADLTVGSLDVTGDQRAEGVITVSGTIANAPAGGDAGTSRVYLSLFVGNNIKTIGSLSVAPIAAGGTASFTTDYTIPAGVVGTWYVHAEADSTAWVAETSEGNNVLEIPIVVQ